MTARLSFGIGRLRVVAVAGILLVCGRYALASKPPVITTWWPDPTTGLMWTGDDLGSTGAGFPHAVAVQACSALRLGGYNDWRLPTLAEVKSVMAPKIYEVYDTDTEIRHGRTVFKSIDEGSDTSPGLKFENHPSSLIWTSEQADATHFFASLGGEPSPVPWKSAWVTFTGAATYCVRTMDPDLRTIAEAAHVGTPVNSVEHLKDAATLYGVEQVLVPGDAMTEAIAKAHAVGAGDKLMVVRACNDAGSRELLEGDWAAANADLAQAHAANKKDARTNRNLAWAKRMEREAKTEPKTATIWVSLNKADVELANGQYAQAEADATAAIALAPDWSDGYSRLGFALEDQKKWTDAVAAFEKGSKLRNDAKIDFKADIKWAEKSAKQAVKNSKQF